MESTFTPAAFFLVAVGLLALVLGPRSWVVPIILLLSIFIPSSNRLIVVGLDFMSYRLVVIFGLLRLLQKKEGAGHQWQPIDTGVLILGIWGVIAYSLLWGDFPSFVYRAGRTFDLIGIYFLFRMYLRSWDDWWLTVRALAVMASILACFMTVELVTQRNWFSLLGNIDEEAWARKGRMRCRGAFGHAISAGIFGATLVPLWLGLWFQGLGRRKWAVTGMVTSTVITIASGSSSPALAYVAALAGFAMWPLRGYLRLFRWAVVIMLISLHLVMKAPVWNLIARVNVVGGSTGYHRYRLMDEFILRFDEWWLIGVKDTEAWGKGLWDVCHQFVLEGVRGGLLGFLCFIAILYFAYRLVGRTLARVHPDPGMSFGVWSLGVALFAHCVAFFGYGYWDQIIVPWYLLLAMIAGLPQMTSALQSSQPVTAGEVPASAVSGVPWPDPAYLQRLGRS